MDEVGTTLGVCNHILAITNPSESFKHGPRGSLGKVLQIYKEKPQSVIDALNAENSPFSQNLAFNLLSILEKNGKSDRKNRYDSYFNFAYYVSRHRYIPTKSLYELLPSCNINTLERQEIALSATELNPGSIKKIGIGAYVALSDNNDIVFIHKHNGSIKIYTLNTVLRVAMFVLGWITFIKVTIVRTKPLDPLKDYAYTFARNLISKIVDYSFYSLILIPAIVSEITTLIGYIQTNYSNSNNCDDDSDESERCAVCLEGLHTDETEVLRCGHIFHKNCLVRSENTTLSAIESQRRCFICRAELS